MIPEGCAHGLQTLEDNCEMLYVHTSDYSQAHEAGIDPLNGELAISWPLPIGSISERDSTESTPPSFFKGVDW